MALGATQKQEMCIIVVQYYSTLSKLLRVTAWVLWFAYNALGRKRHKGPLSAEEWNQAEKYWVLQTQKKAFGEEKRLTEQGQPLDRKSELSELHLLLDDHEILGVGGRLQKLRDNMDTKHPIILPNRHTFMELVITQVHLRRLHGGVADTMTELWTRFWFPRAPQLLKRLTRGCLICSRARATSTSAPHAPLPLNRIAESRPFHAMGVYFAGLLYVKETDAISSKAHVVLFTCATTRALHLELVTSLSAPVFLLAVRRFVSGRGVSATIYSNNGSTFKKASKDLNTIWKMMNQEGLTSHLAERRLE